MKKIEVSSVFGIASSCHSSCPIIFSLYPSREQHRRLRGHCWYYSDTCTGGSSSNITIVFGKLVLVLSKVERKVGSKSGHEKIAIGSPEVEYADSAAAAADRLSVFGPGISTDTNKNISTVAFLLYIPFICCPLAVLQWLRNYS